MAGFVREYRQLHRPLLRSVARRVALDALTLPPTRRSSLSAFSDIPRIQILLLHHVFEDEEAGFRKLMAFLSLHFELVAYSAAMDRLASGHVERPLLAISFDDGFKSCLTAARILEEHGTSGCFFVCPAFVGERRPAEVRRICRERWAMPPTELMTWEDLESLHRRGHEICAHTMAHPYMHQLPLVEARREIIACRQTLLERFGVSDHFAWPYGRFQHMRPEIAAAVFEAGFGTCASGQRGAHAAVAPAGIPYCVRRDSVVAAWPVRHVEYFLARSAARPLVAEETWPRTWNVTGPHHGLTPRLVA